MSSSSSSSTSSASPGREVPSKKLKSKGKGKSKSNAQTTADGKNEGVDATWAYKPPPSHVLYNNDADAGEFDWDSVANDDDLELWLIRVPDSVKPKFLENVKVEVPPTSAKSVKAGSLQRKHATFDIWSVGEDNDQDIGGEELKGISCLLPRKNKKGQLYPAPKPIARHIIISARAVTPTFDPTSTPAGPVEKYKNPPRQSYPKEVLKHRFMPYGSMIGTGAEDTIEPMVVDEPEPVPVTDLPPSSPKTMKVDPTPSKTKGKKRKVDGEASAVKKTKKAKTK